MDLACYAFSLGPIVHIRVERQQLAFVVLRIDILLDLMLIVMDQRISCINDIARRAIVALEFENLRIGITLTEIQYIAYVGSAERIDRLRIIAHHADIVLRFGQTAHQQILDIIGILVLIDQHIAKLLLQLLADIGMLINQTEHIEQQVVKIHSIGRL